MKAFVLAVFCMGLNVISSVEVTSKNAFVLPPSLVSLTGSLLGSLQNKDDLLKHFQLKMFEFPGSLFARPRNDSLQVLKQMCLTHSNESALAIVENAPIEAESCLRSAVPGMDAILGDSQELCKTLHDGMRACVADFAWKMEACMDETSEYVPRYNVDVLDSMFVYLCAPGEDRTSTLITAALKPNGCLNKIQSATHECLSETEKFATTSSAVFRNISKQELCSETEVWKNCLERNLEETCSGDDKALVAGLLTAFHEPCSSSSSPAVNLAALIFLLLMRIF